MRPLSAEQEALLIVRVDASPYSRAQWLEALEEFSEWLTSQKNSAPFEQQLAYLSCCVESVVQKYPQPPLKVVLADLLARFGFDAATFSSGN